MADEKVGDTDDFASTATAETQSVIRPYGYSVSKCGYCKGSRSHLLQTNERATTTTPHQTPNHTSSNSLSYPSSSPTSSSSSSPTSKSSKSSKSYSVLADSISPSLYEELINRGWRRSGVHLYKPQNFSSCCPTLTIRLLTREFKPTKSQRKILKKMENILRPLPSVRKEGEIPTARATATTAIATPMSMLKATSTPKKQKRNHLEKQKFSHLETTEMPSNSDNCGNPELGTAKISSSCSLSLEEQILANGILQKLEEATTRAIEKCCRDNFQKQQKNGEFKTSYRILPPSKRERKQSRVRVVSAICAQTTGRYQFFRDQLAEEVVRLMVEDQQLIPAFQFKNGRNTRAVPSNNCSTVSIVFLDAHPPSGQIKCTIELERQEEKDETKRHKDIDEDNNNDDDIEINYSKEKGVKESGDVSGGKLARWYTKTTGKKIHLKSNQHCITIDTIPAHKSALNPDVHRLYAHYQHVVHNDPNPFSDNPNTVSMNTGDGNNSEEDDEELKLDTDDPSELDWGHAPTYFTENVSAMLTSYIRSIQSNVNRRAVLSNYYSFYQFLVEAPFPLHDISNKRNINSNNNGNGTQQQSKQSWNRKDYSHLPCGLYHQHYRVGGEFLVAVGVIDVLPTGLSSVYLFYHPSFSHELVALGKYAILKEIEFARDTLQVPNYYLGYYIESCQKMRYKAEYKPSQMLCPRYYHWVDATMAISKLQMTPRHVCPFIEATPKCDEKKDSDSTAARKQKKTNICIDALNSLQMDIGAGMNVTIDMLQSNGVEAVKPILEEFILEFSPPLSRKCILKLT